MLLASGVGLGLLVWGVHLLWNQVIDTTPPDPFALVASMVLLLVGATLWVPHAVALRGWRQRRAASGAGEAGWGSTPTVVLGTVTAGATVALVFTLVRWPGIPSVAWLVPVGLLALEACVVAVRTVEVRSPDAA